MPYYKVKVTIVYENPSYIEWPTIFPTVTAMTMLPLPPAGVMYSDTACQKDYLVIVGGSQTGFGPVSMFFAKDRYCGYTLGKLNLCWDITLYLTEQVKLNN